MTEENLFNFRIYGDNIIECERALALVAESLHAKVEYANGPIYAPICRLLENDKIVGTTRLLPGYGKWGVDIQEILKKNGAPLREATDAIVTKVTSDNKEEILFAIEYCNALPAGNNAWQRMGRAIACASTNIPYLYFAEIGGIELDEKRKPKAPRFPNPVIPFSYITLGKNYGSLTVPIYSTSPSSPKNVKQQFSQTFGLDEGVELVKGIILQEDIAKVLEVLILKNLELVNLLSSNRKRGDTLTKKEWKEFLDLNEDKRLHWLETKNKKWSKKSSEKVLKSATNTFRKLLRLIEKESLSVGGGDIPICLIPSKKRKELSQKINSLYNGKIDEAFVNWIAEKETPLVIVWITGFKPKGEDSRPDRGLVPMARMLLVPDVEILSIVYGPGKKEMWDLLIKSYTDLAEQNGLWEAILNLSDAVLSDSATAPKSPICILTSRKRSVTKEKIDFPVSNLQTSFSEQDVDSSIHFLFSRFPFEGVFECMCNPPGGDWSGLSFFDFSNDIEYRWTSLPRVSKSNGKRPDHVIEIKIDKDTTLLLSLESKDNSSDFEKDIGTRLNTYTRDLIESTPTIKRKTTGTWEAVPEKEKIKENIVYCSGGAFCFKNFNEIRDTFARGGFDIILALEFLSAREKVELHVKTNDKAKHLLSLFTQMEKNLNNKLEVQIH